METLTNVEVGKVFKGKSGEGQYGPWQIWDVYLRDDKRKFAYFEKGGFIPEAGLMIQVLKYEVVQKGEYTNYNVKELTPDPNWYSGKEPETPPKTPQNRSGSTFSQNRGDDIGPMTMWGKYIGEFVSAGIGYGYTGGDLDKHCKDATETFVDCLAIFEREYSKVNGVEDYEPIETSIEKIDDEDEIPLPDEPPY